MLRLAWRNLRARKVRMALSGISVVLGVAFVAGTLVLTATLDRVFTDLFGQTTKGVSVVVRGAPAFDDPGLAADPSAVPKVAADLQRTLEAVPGVAAVQADVSGYAQLVGSDGKPVSTGGAPTLGVTLATSSELEALTLREGRRPATADEVVLDVASARKGAWKVGDSVPVLLARGRQQLTVTGLVGLGDADSVGGASVIGFTLDGAKKWLGAPGVVDDYRIAAAPGTDNARLLAEVRGVLPDGAEAVSGQTVAAEQADAISSALGFLSTALLVFAGIALFVGGFLIVNTYAMLVAQRTQELALLRALGASRGQVTRSVVAEAAIVGLLSGGVGLGLGIGLAVGLRALLGAVGVDLPAGPLVVTASTVVVSLLVGLLVTVVAAVLPARRASRIPPVAAMRADLLPPESRSLRSRSLVGAALAGVGVAGIVLGLTTATLSVLGLGVVSALLAVTTLSPLFASPVARALGWPVARLGGLPGRLARDNASRNPRRTSATAAALMIGLTMVTAVTVLGASLKASVSDVVGSSLGADYLLSTQNFKGFSPDLVDRLAGLPGVEVAAGVTSTRAQVDGQVVGVDGAAPAGLQKILTLDVTAGDLTGLPNGLAVSQDVSDNRGLRVGDAVPVVFGTGYRTELPVVAVFAPNGLSSSYIVSDTTFAQGDPGALDVVAGVVAAPGADRAALHTALEAAVADFPTVQVQDRSELVQSQADQVDQLVNILTVLLLLALFIAVLGIVNTLALSVVERTRELGMLRAVGLQRSGVRRMVTLEAVIISVYGALLGVVLGAGLGWALVQGLADQGVTVFSLPAVRLVVFVLLAGVAGVLAAVLPAFRAARTSVLQAVSAT